MYGSRYKGQNQTSEGSQSQGEGWEDRCGSRGGESSKKGEAAKLRRVLGRPSGESLTNEAFKGSSANIQPHCSDIDCDCEGEDQSKYRAIDPPATLN